MPVRPGLHHLDTKVCHTSRAQSDVLSPDICLGSNLVVKEMSIKWGEGGYVLCVATYKLSGMSGCTMSSTTCTKRPTTTTTTLSRTTISLISLVRPHPTFVHSPIMNHFFICGDQSPTLGYGVVFMCAHRVFLPLLSLSFQLLSRGNLIRAFDQKDDDVVGSWREGGTRQRTHR